MKNITIFIVIYFLAIIEIFSQSDFRNGYIIKINNDTIYGLINYKGNKANSKKCIFKKESSSEKQEYTPNDLKAYRFINSKYYVSKSIESKNKTEFIFLEYLINGIIDIYYYRDDLGEHYLIDKGDGKLSELKNEEKEIIINGTSYIKESKEYIGILKYTFSENPLIAKKVEKIDLTHNSLIKITHDYHKEVCADEECIIYEKNYQG